MIAFNDLFKFLQTSHNLEDEEFTLTSIEKLKTLLSYLYMSPLSWKKNSVDFALGQYVYKYFSVKSKKLPDETC